MDQAGKKSVPVSQLHSSSTPAVLYGEQSRAQIPSRSWRDSPLRLGVCRLVNYVSYVIDVSTAIQLNVAPPSCGSMPAKLHTALWIGCRTGLGVCVCVRACVHACMRACVRVYVYYQEMVIVLIAEET